MNIDKTQNADKITFTLSGKLDTMTSPQLQEVLIPAFDDAKNIKLDFTGIEYVSSAGLRVLLMGEKTSKAKGGSLTLTGVSAEIMEIFELTHFADFLTIEEK